MDDAGVISGAERVGELSRVLQSPVERQRAQLQLFRERFSVNQRHHEKADAVVLADVVERTDVRVFERSNGASFAVQSAHGTADRGPRHDSTLMATVRSRRVSRARYTSPMPPAPSRRTICTGRVWCRLPAASPRW